MMVRRARVAGRLANAIGLLGIAAIASAARAGEPVKLAATELRLPGGPGEVWMDYLAFDRATGRLWVPAGNTGKVDVLDTRSGKLSVVDGFVTAARLGRDHMAGPSSATVGSGVVYIGSRADATLCAIDHQTLKRLGCVSSPSEPDGLCFVAATKELWVTAPRENSLALFDATVPAAPRRKQTLKLEGAPKGYAIDDRRGIFYTNLEDRDFTLAIDVQTRQPIGRFKTGCGADGPRGLALDTDRQLLFVACGDGAVTLDVGHGGLRMSRLKTPDGVDGIDYYAPRRLLYIAAGRGQILTIAQVAEGGALKETWFAPTSLGARTVIVDAEGTAYVADSVRGRLLVVRPPPTR